MTATSFFTRRDFKGDDDHRPPLPPEISNGETSYFGQITFTNIGRSVAQNLLPGALRLAENIHPTLRNEHPIVHMLGKQAHPSWRTKDKIDFGNDYAEFILFIPFVQNPASPQWYNYVARMYLGDVRAIEIGALFGYRKRPAIVRTVQMGFEVDVTDLESGERKRAFQSRTERHGNWSSNHDAESLLPQYSELKAILAMPFLGVDPMARVALGSYFELRFDDAQVAPISSKHQYSPAFEPPGLAGQVYESVPEGAIDLQNLPWRISYPPAKLSW